jgi:hypothetical protein
MAVNSLLVTANAFRLKRIGSPETDPDSSDRLGQQTRIGSASGLKIRRPELSQKGIYK